MCRRDKLYVHPKEIPQILNNFSKSCLYMIEKGTIFLKSVVSLFGFVPQKDVFNQKVRGFQFQVLPTGMHIGQTKHGAHLFENGYCYSYTEEGQLLLALKRVSYQINRFVKGLDEPLEPNFNIIYSYEDVIYQEKELLPSGYDKKKLREIDDWGKDHNNGVLFPYYLKKRNYISMPGQSNACALWAVAFLFYKSVIKKKNEVSAKNLNIFNWGAKFNMVVDRCDDGESRDPECLYMGKDSELLIRAFALVCPQQMKSFNEFGLPIEEISNLLSFFNLTDEELFTVKDSESHYHALCLFDFIPTYDNSDPLMCSRDAVSGLLSDAEKQDYLSLARSLRAHIDEQDAFLEWEFVKLIYQYFNLAVEVYCLTDGVYSTLYKAKLPNPIKIVLDTKAKHFYADNKLEVEQPKIIKASKKPYGDFSYNRIVLRQIKMLDENFKNGRLLNNRANSSFAFNQLIRDVHESYGDYHFIVKGSKLIIDIPSSQVNSGNKGVIQVNTNLYLEDDISCGYGFILSIGNLMTIPGDCFSAKKIVKNGVGFALNSTFFGSKAFIPELLPLGRSNYRVKLSSPMSKISGSTDEYQVDSILHRRISDHVILHFVKVSIPFGDSGDMVIDQRMGAYTEIASEFLSLGSNYETFNKNPDDVLGRCVTYINVHKETFDDKTTISDPIFKQSFVTALNAHSQIRIDMHQYVNSSDTFLKSLKSEFERHFVTFANKHKDLFTTALLMSEASIEKKFNMGYMFDRRRLPVGYQEGPFWAFLYLLIRNLRFWLFFFIVVLLFAAPYLAFASLYTTMLGGLSFMIIPDLFSLITLIFALRKYFLYILFLLLVVLDPFMIVSGECLYLLRGKMTWRRVGYQYIESITRNFDHFDQPKVYVSQDKIDSMSGLHKTNFNNAQKLHFYDQQDREVSYNKVLKLSLDLASRDQPNKWTDLVPPECRGLAPHIPTPDLIGLLYAFFSRHLIAKVRPVASDMLDFSSYVRTNFRPLPKMTNPISFPKYLKHVEAAKRDDYKRGYENAVNNQYIRKTVNVLVKPDEKQYKGITIDPLQVDDKKFKHRAIQNPSSEVKAICGWVSYNLMTHLKLDPQFSREFIQGMTMDQISEHFSFWTSTIPNAAFVEVDQANHDAH